MVFLFWVSIITILYVYIGYPILIYCLSLFYKKHVIGKYIYPTISIVVAAYNEERCIENKIKSLLNVDYPQERMEIIIGSDGSTDGTNGILKEYQKREEKLLTGMDSRLPSGKAAGFRGNDKSDGNDRSGENDLRGGNDIKIKAYFGAQRLGKPSMLNRLVQMATGEILVFTDARQVLDGNVLKELVKHFADKKVGSVSAALFFMDESHASKAAEGVGIYWNYEKFIRKSESRMGSMLGATGALYAIRRKLFPELPKDLILDDVFIPMKIVEKGYRAIFDKKAKVYDRLVKNPQEEYLRKVRTLAGNFQLFLYLKELFNPFKGKISWQFFSHKFLRLMVPFLLIFVFLSNMFMLDVLVYKIFFILQVTFYSLALLGRVIKHSHFFIDVPYMFCVLNSAAVVGLYRFLMKKQAVTWKRAE